jgi:enoyl-CoA hydratase/carnithine racemase
LRAAPPIALAAAKQAVYASEAHDLETMLCNETEAQLRCFESDDCHEGVRRFGKSANRTLPDIETSTGAKSATLNL